MTDLLRPNVVVTRFGAFDTDPLPGQTIVPRDSSNAFEGVSEIPEISAPIFKTYADVLSWPDLMQSFRRKVRRV